MNEVAQSPGISEFCNQFERVFCINLPRSTDRRKYVTNYFLELGIENYEFFNATDRADEIVEHYYKNQLVTTYPPCFRCGQHTCGSDNCNNILIPAQVATFITYLRLWREIVDTNTETALIVEDDIKFTDYASDVARDVVADNTLEKLDFFDRKPTLLRLGWALSSDHHLGAFRFERSLIKMSNPCHAINLSMAWVLLKNFKKITTTVDIYQHQIIGSQIDNYSILPPLSYELSWSMGEVDSLIHPKAIRVEYLKTNHPTETQKIESSEKAVENHVSHVLYRPLLVVGHPHCGSGYVCRLLRSVGLDVGYQKIGKAGIASWRFAVADDEHLYIFNKYAANEYALDEYTWLRKFKYFQFIIHHVRDPRSAIPRIIKEIQRKSQNYESRCKYISLRYGVDLLSSLSELEQAALSYIYWNKIIEEADRNLVIKVESATEKLREFLVSQNLIELNTAASHSSFNAFQETRCETTAIDERDWKKIDKEIMWLLNQQCTRYGYEEIVF